MLNVRDEEIIIVVIIFICWVVVRFVICCGS